MITTLTFLTTVVVAACVAVCVLGIAALLMDHFVK